MKNSINSYGIAIYPVTISIHEYAINEFVEYAIYIVDMALRDMV